MTIKIKHAYGLGEIQQDARMIRQAVFVEEQGFSVQDEYDHLDSTTIHIVAYTNTQAVATARLHEEQLGTWHIQRVATLASMRHQGIGRLLFNEIEALAPQFNIHTLTLGAQLQARHFYEQLGFNSHGDIFLDANVPHIEMIKLLNR